MWRRHPRYPRHVWLSFLGDKPCVVCTQPTSWRFNFNGAWWDEIDNHNLNFVCSDACLTVMKFRARLEGLSF